MKEEKHEVGSRAEIMQVVFEGWGVIVIMEFHLHLLYYFSQIDFQGRPSNTLSCEKCNDGEKKVSIWSGKSVGGRKLISLICDCILTVTSLGHFKIYSTLGCPGIGDC